MIGFRWQALIPVTVAMTMSGALLAGAGPAHAASITWVSGVGDDANPCSRTAPCKTFAGAISKTDEGGVITALDSGGFGQVTITKSITINGGGKEAGILNAGTTAVTVNAASDDTVILRDLDITGMYQAAVSCAPNGVSGVRVLNAKSVVIEDSRFTEIRQSSVLVAPTASNPTVTVRNSRIRNTCGSAIDAAPAAGRTAIVNVDESTISANDVGVNAAEGGTVNLTGTTLFGNRVGTRTSGNGVVNANSTNRIAANEPLGNPAVAAAPAFAGRTWVSGVGDDANPCSRTSPCKTFAAAFSKTATGGEINVLDPGLFGTVTINRAMTIDATGSHAEILPGPGLNGIIVNTSGSEDVILRGLTIIGHYTAGGACVFDSASGIHIQNARTVHVEDSRIDGFSTAGVNVVPNTASTRVVVEGTTVNNVCGNAVSVAPAVQQPVPVLVKDSALLNSGTGVRAVTGGTVWLTSNALLGDAQQTVQAGGTIIDMDAPAPAPSPSPSPTPPPTPDPAPAPTPSPPAKPGGLTVHATTKKVRSSWQAPTGATGYRVTLSGKSPKSRKITKKQTTTYASARFKVKLKKRSTVRVCVTASNAAGNSSAACAKVKVK